MLKHLACSILLLGAAGVSAANDANRLTYLDENDPFYVSLDFPKLTTPQWVGDSGVDAVVVLAIDDMRSAERYERYLRPILQRLKGIDGRAPVSIMTNEVDPTTPQLQKWLAEGVSIECHTIDHPCPILQKGDFDLAKARYDDCIELLASIPGNEPIAFRVPCMDSMNSPSPRFYAEIFGKTTSQGSFLRVDSSVMSVSTPDDPAVPRALVVDDDGQSRFEKYFPRTAFINSVNDYPYPYVIGRNCWEFPCAVPSDWEAQNKFGKNRPSTVEAFKAQLDICVLKQGSFNLVFHPWGWIRSDQIVSLIDHAVSSYGKRVLFLTFREAWERLRQNLLNGHTLRDQNGGDGGVRLLDINNDGSIDVVIGNGDDRVTRVWNPTSTSWRTLPFPIELASDGSDSGARFGILQSNGAASVIVSNEKIRGAWHFEKSRWRADSDFFNGLEIDGQPVRTSLAGRDLGVRLRDIDSDGICEIIVSNPSQQAIFRLDRGERRWVQLPFSLPPDTSIVDAAGQDSGLRFVDFDEDGRDDVIYSDATRYSLHLFGTPTTGWSHEVTSATRGPETQTNDIPIINRHGTNNGVWFRRGELWVQNEDTSELEDIVDRRPFTELLKTVEPRPREPAEALASFHVRRGYRIELVASEPLVRDPAAFDWDPQGRLWVAEMADYPLGLDGKGKPGGRVVILDDRDGDGSYDSSTVFAELPFPTGVRPWRGGALITTVPRIVFAKDLDGDDRADSIDTLYEGFHHGNEQHLVNTLAWGLDNWIHCANGDSAGTVRSIKTGHEVKLGANDFRIRPNEGLIELETGITQFGRARDDWGNWFGCSNPTPIFHFVLVDHYLKRNPHFIPPSPRRILYADEARRVFPTSRTLPRHNQPYSANYFTSCNSLLFCRDPDFGTHLAGDAFISEPAHNLVHHIAVKDNGVTFSASRAAREQRSEFVSSSDNWFRPTKLRLGPDGALWIADMYRAIIEHPQYFHTGQKDLDVRAGDDRGRIYRVVPVNSQPRPFPNLADEPTEGLVDKLASPSGWTRDTAQQLIVQRRELTVVPKLNDAATNASSAIKRLHALCTLDGLGALEPDIVKRALDDAHPEVRRHAVRLSEPFLEGPARLGNAILALLDDPSLPVRMQLAYTLGEWPHPAASRALAILALRHHDNAYLLAAAESSALPHLEELISSVLSSSTDAHDSLLERLFTMAGRAARDDADLERKIFDGLLEPHGDHFAAWQLNAAAAILRSRGNDVPQILLEPTSGRSEQAVVLLAHASTVAVDDTAEEAYRAAASRLLGSTGPLCGKLQASQVEHQPSAERHRSILVELLSPHSSPKLRQSAAEALGNLGGSETPQALVGAWRSQTPQTRGVFLDILLSRTHWHTSVLDALDSSGIRHHEIDASRRKRLLESGDKAVAERAKRVFEHITVSSRQEVIEKYSPLPKSVSRDRGLVVFEKKCAACHRLAERGHSVGPDLAALTDKSTEKLLISILDPNRNVEEKYTQYTVITRGGEVHTGLFDGESGNAVTLLVQEGKKLRLLRKDIATIENAGLSFMPEGLEEGTTPEDMASLIEFLRVPTAP